jgi:hypothetical protein
MRGRAWLLIGIALGVAIGIGEVPFLAGAGRTLTETAEHVVGSGGNRIIRAFSSHGASARVVTGLSAFLAVLLPGVTALLLIVAARGTLRLRAIIGLLIVVLGAASYAYHPHGVATGALFLALAVAAAAVALSGPLVVAPLGALAGLIGTELLPRLVRGGATVSAATTRSLYTAIAGHNGSPEWFRVIVLIVAGVPLALGAWLATRR